MDSELVSQPLIHCLCCLQRKFSETITHSLHPTLHLTVTHCFGVQMHIHSITCVTLSNLDSVCPSNLTFDFLPPVSIN